jgi:hypothetical protein
VVAVSVADDEPELLASVVEVWVIRNHITP